MANDQPIYCIGNISSNYHMASGNAYYLGIEDPKFVLSAPRNLDAVKLCNSFNKNHVVKGVANPIYECVD